MPTAIQKIEAQKKRLNSDTDPALSLLIDAERLLTTQEPDRLLNVRFALRNIKFVRRWHGSTGTVK